MKNLAERLFVRDRKANRMLRIKEFPIAFGNHGIELKGKVMIPQGADLDNPVPGVVLCHGFGAGYAVMEPSARVMARQGVATIIFDLRGHGTSGGTVDGKMAEDVVDAWDLLSQFPEVDKGRMGLVGHSLGSLSVIMAADKVGNPRALVALSCPPEISDPSISEGPVPVGQWGLEIGSGVAEYPRRGAFPWLRGLAALFCRAYMFLLRFRVKVDWREFSEALPQLKMSEALRKLNGCSKLFVFCEGDTVTPYAKSAFVYEAACLPKQMILAKGGFHSTPLLPGKLRSQWTSWAANTLKAKM
jgi:pimeloyl-ACP methyl ester carboxylesterase